MKTVAALAALAALAGFYFLWDLPGRDRQAGGEVQDRLVLSRNIGKIEELSIRRPDGAIDLVRRDGEWRLVRPLAALAEEYEVRELLEVLRRMTAETRIERDEQDQFGFSEPFLSLGLKGGDGSLLVEVGAANPAETGRYLRLAARDEVFLVQNDWIEKLNKDLFQLRDKIVLEVDRPATGLVELNSPKGRVRLVRDQGAWQVNDGEKNRPADPFLVDGLLGALFSHRIRRFAGGEDPGEPGLTMELNSGPGGGGTGWWVHLWPPKEGSGLIRGRSSRHEEPFEVERALWPALAFSAPELADRRLMVYDPKRVTKMELVRFGGSGAERLVTEKNRNGIWKVIEPDQSEPGRWVDPADAAALLYDLAVIRYLSEGGRPFERPELTIALFDRSGLKLAGLEVGPEDSARRPGEKMWYVMERGALAGLPGPWALKRNES